VKDAASAISVDLDARITTATSAKVGDLDARVKTAVDRATVNLPTLAESFAKAQIATLDVPTLITRATSQVEQRITTSVGQRFEAEQTRRTEDINGAVLNLRKEMVSTAKSEVEVLRKENDKKLKTIEERLPRVIIPLPNPIG
jgi:hypothetical protein